MARYQALVQPIDTEETLPAKEVTFWTDGAPTPGEPWTIKLEDGGELTMDILHTQYTRSIGWIVHLFRHIERDLWQKQVWTIMKG
jgi:hypothetical protein